MGFAGSEEIVRFLTDLDTAPAAAKAQMIRRMLPKIRDDALHASCARALHRLRQRDQDPNRTTKIFDRRATIGLACR